MSPTFEQLLLPPVLVAELDRQNRRIPFPIQAATIPDALAGRDILGRAPTGSGKTLAFGLPLLANVEKGSPRAPKALILSPTRELAEQIKNELQPLAKAVKRTISAVYGGTGFGPQVNAMNNGVDVLVACPGRLEDLISQGVLTLGSVAYVVVDEADRMADMGFLPSVRRILDQTSPSPQVLLFSATLDKAVQVLVDDYLKDPVSHSFGEAEPDLTKVVHRFWNLGKTERVDRAAQVVDEHGATIVFCRTRHGVDRVARQLKQRGVKAGWIHGGRTQSQRNSALHSFTEGKVTALVATDVAARGIHVDGVACVVHYDPPADDKDYVHRSGRTARAGDSGVVYSFLIGDQHKAARKLQEQLGIAVGFDEPGPIPAWVKLNQDAYAARKHGGSKAPKTRSIAKSERPDRSAVKKPKASTARPQQSVTAPQPSDKQPSGSPSDRGPKHRTKKGGKASAKSSRTGRRRPANRKGGKKRGPSPRRG